MLSVIEREINSRILWSGSLHLHLHLLPHTILEFGPWSLERGTLKLPLFNSHKQANKGIFFLRAFIEASVHYSIDFMLALCTSICLDVVLFSLEIRLCFLGLDWNGSVWSVCPWVWGCRCLRGALESVEIPNRGFPHQKVRSSGIQNSCFGVLGG